jgi:hypothetical protein
VLQAVAAVVDPAAAVAVSAPEAVAVVQRLRLPVVVDSAAVAAEPSIAAAAAVADTPIAAVAAVADTPIAAAVTAAAAAITAAVADLSQAPSRVR